MTLDRTVDLLAAKEDEEITLKEQEELEELLKEGSAEWNLAAGDEWAKRLLFFEFAERLSDEEFVQAMATRIEKDSHVEGRKALPHTRRTGKRLGILTMAASILVFGTLFWLIVWGPSSLKQDDKKSPPEKNEVLDKQDAWKKKGGAKLTYRLLFKENFKGNRKDVTKRVVQVLQNRIARRGLKEPQIKALGNDRIVIQLAVRTRADLNSYRDLLSKIGKYEEREVAPKDIHQAWKQTGYDFDEVPDGWRAIENDRKMASAYDYLSHDYILVSEKVTASGADMKYAGTSRSLVGKGWQIDFELTEEGGKKFDLVAERLYNQDPNGLIAIILDGKIVSKPVIQGYKYNGKGTISGDFDKKAASDLANVLSSGHLPVAIGRLGTDGKPHPGVPEKEEFVAPKK